MKWKLNMPEFVHYVAGTALLAAAWLPIMDYFNGNVAYSIITWGVWYIIIDQILHVVVKGEKINIIEKS